MMAKNQDIRWVQRFNHFKKALNQLTAFVEKGKLSELEEQGLIQSFEYTYELAWNTMKDFYESQGETNLIQGSRDAFRLAFKRGLIKDGMVWMNMIQSRSLTVHTYDKKIAKKVVKDILQIYFLLFQELRSTLEELK